MSQEPVVFANVIVVDPDRLDDVVDAVRGGLEQVISRRPGFRSAEVLADAQRTRVINLVVWESAADAVATQQDPAAAEFAGRIASLATSASPGVFHTVHSQR